MCAYREEFRKLQFFNRIIDLICVREKKQNTLNTLAMAIYAIGLTPLLEMIIEFVADIKSAAFGDGLTAVGKCETIRI